MLLAMLSQKAFSIIDRNELVKHWKQYTTIGNTTTTTLLSSARLFASLTLDEQVASPRSLGFYSEGVDGH